MRIPRICHAKYATKLVHGHIPNVSYLQLWRLSTHFQFDHLDLVSDYWGFIPLVQRVVEHLDSIVVKLVGKTRPIEGEGHGNEGEVSSSGFGKY